MKHIILQKHISRKFRKKGTQYLCQFRQHNQDYFITDCTIDDLDEAMSYVSLVVRFFTRYMEGKVVAEKTKEVIFTCQLLVMPKYMPARYVREVPAEYAQLAMEGFDLTAVQQTNARRKRKVDTTLAKLRQLHDELNTQLYSKPTERPAIHSPIDAFNILQCFIGNLDHEELWVMNLDTRNRVMSLIALYKGSVNSSNIRIAEVFRQAIVDNAPAIVVAHNHPSGDPAPSPDDVATTRAIVQAGKLLDINVLDHVVIGCGRYTSLKERGLGF
jgi:DNA repair protein RadC